MEELKQKILEFIKKSGPTIPAKVNKDVGSSLMFTSAIMSELVANKLIRLSNAKIGSSPVYYVPGQESKLVMLKDYLSNRPKQAFTVIQEKKILRDSQCEPWLRVALREIKDFAKPISVNIKGNSEIFWKWYMTQDEIAKKVITEIVSGEVKKEEPIPVKKEVKETIKESIEEEIKKPEPPKVIPKPIKKEEPKQEPLIPLPPDSTGEFHDAVLNFLKEKQIDILDNKIIRKNRELNFIVKLPSPVGQLNFFVKAKNKAKINDGDLSLAYSEGQQSKLPVIYISEGDLTKKANKFLEGHMKGLVFKKI